MSAKNIKTSRQELERLMEQLDVDMDQLPGQGDPGRYERAEDQQLAAMLDIASNHSLNDEVLYGEDFARAALHDIWILYWSELGFVTYDQFDSEAEARAAWDKLVAEDQP